MKSNDGESLRRWLGPLPFGVFLLLALAACFPHLITGSESFYSRDYGVLGYPNIHFQREAFWRGELPFWNPYSNCGQPFLAQWGTMTLYPMSLIYLLLPLPGSLGLFCLFHVWLAGLGMYFLVRHWTKDELGASFGGAAYVFNGLMFASFIWPNYLVALGWMPWVVWLAERAWREGGRLIPTAAILAAMQMLSGAPEVVLLTWLMVGCLWLFDVARSLSAVMPFIGRFVLVILLASGLTAIQLLPFFELLQHAHRDAGFATDKWQLPAWGWANFLVPLFGSFETPSGQYFQYSQGFLSSVYLGALVLTFALAGIFRWPDRRVWLLAGLAAGSMFLAFGENTPVYKTLRSMVPALGLARYPVKFLLLLAFVMPLLAGCGLAAAAQTRQRGLAYSIGFLMLILMLGIAWAAHGQRFPDMSGWPENFRLNVAYSWTKASAGQNWPDGLQNTALRAGLFVVALCLVLRATYARGAAALLLMLGVSVLALDALTHTPRQNPTLPAAAFTSRAWPETSNPPKLGEGRVMLTPEAEEILTFLSSTNAQRLWEFRRRAEWSSLNLLDSIPKVNGSMTLQTREQRSLEQALYSMTNRLPAGLLDFLGVRYTSSREKASEWVPRPTALPLLTAGQGAIFLSESQMLSRLTNAGFAPKEVVYLSQDAQSLVTASNAVAATVSGIEFVAHKIQATVETAEPTVVVVAQSFYPGWEATVDGSQRKLLRANHAFQAIAIPAGQHRVEFRFRPSSFFQGAWLTAATGLACCLMLAWPRRSSLQG